MSQATTIAQQVAALRASMVAKSNRDRAIEIAHRERIGFRMAVRIALVASAVSLTACGGGSLTAEESAQHDADMQALAAMKTTQPVDCSGGACK